MRSWLCLALMLCLAAPAWATDIVVTTRNDGPVGPTDGECSLREAVQAANTDTAVDSCPAGSGQDRILLPNVALYTLTSELVVTTDIDLYGTGTPAERTRVRVASNVTARHINLQKPASGPDAELRIFHIDFENGTAVNGGSIYVERDQRLIVQQARFSNNLATAPTGLGGGAVYIESDGFASFFETTFRSNQALGTGGAILSTGSFLTLDRTTFDSNSAAQGGAVTTIAVTSITNSTFTSNSSNEAGAVDLRGGGIFSHSITSTTVYLNSSTGTQAGKAGGVDCSGATQPCLVRNSLIVNNRKNGSNSSPDSDVSGMFTSQGFNALGQASSTDGFTAGTDQFNVSVNLNLISDNGGHVTTIALPSGHEALNAGDCTATATDARGFDRPSTGCDAGAHENESDADGVVAQPRIFLQGAFRPLPYLTTSRNASLPLAQPFAYRGYTGTESVTQHRVSTVDWAMVRLLVPFGSALIEIDRRAGLLQSSGFVSDLDGVSPLVFDDAGTIGGVADYVVEVIPRNHIPLSTVETLELNKLTAVYPDFTGLDYANANLGRTVALNNLSGSPVFRGARAGDAAGNGLVDGLDALAIEAALTSSTPYSPSDLDYDGDVDLTDLLELWLPNNGR
ncbi:MAG: choice-of-anchor Q domain-containing protein [Bacteroidota bacterium]